MEKLRWSHSVHSQMESLFASIKAIGVSKNEAPKGHIRSLGTWNAYRQEAHSFAKFLYRKGVNDLRDAEAVVRAAKEYLSSKIFDARSTGATVQTQETRVSALTAFERAYNTFFAQRGMNIRLDFSTDRKEYLSLARVYLSTGRNYSDGTRAYPKPEALIAAIQNPTHALQATLQLQAGLRAEGSGAPSGKVANPLTVQNLKGFASDPVTRTRVGVVSVREKGGKWTRHYLPEAIYRQLQGYLEKHGPLQSRYKEYLASVVQAAKATGQYSKGRGSHALKTTFAQRRYQQCTRHGFSHERALQAVALELGHNRMEITRIYTKG